MPTMSLAGDGMREDGCHLLGNKALSTFDDDGLWPGPGRESEDKYHLSFSRSCILAAGDRLLIGLEFFYWIILPGHFA
jgi:hypothetical protein